MTTPWLLGAGGLPGGGLEINPWLGLVLAILLVILNGFFVAAEFALVKVRPTQIEPHVASGSRRGKLAGKLVDHLDAYLSATQLGITLASLALGWIGEPAFSWILEPLLAKIPWIAPESTHWYGLIAAFLTITFLHIVLGELAPKSLAIRKPEPTALWVAAPLYLFHTIMWPAIWVLNKVANWILRAFGIQPLTEGEHAHDEEEIRLLLASARTSRLSSSKRELLDNIFELSHRSARQIMVPRADVVFLSSDKAVDENLEIARDSGHTRFPLCEGSLDRVTGMIHIKDLFQNAEPLESLESVSRKIPFVPETLELDRLLQRMLTEKLHMAAVLDEFGGVSGIVTLENVIEEIVGEIQDEFDAEKPEIDALGEDTYSVSGGMLVADVETELGIEFSDRDEDTLAGVVLSEIGRLPLVGDKATVGPLEMEVRETRLNRITRLKVTVRADPDEPDDETTDSEDNA